MDKNEIPRKVWAMGLDFVVSDEERLLAWFHREIPRFDNRRPIDILKEDGEDVICKRIINLLR